jgi:hypothetical protein
VRRTLGSSFLLGAGAGALVAVIVGVILLLPFPFSHEAHIRLVTAGFWLCPFYLLMFMSVVHTAGAVVAVSLVGNAALYGIAAACVHSVWRLLR